MAAPQNPNVGTSNAFGQPPPPSAHQFRPGTGPGPYGVPPMTGPGSFNKGPGMPPPGSAGLPNQGMPAPPQNVPMYGQRPPGPGPNMGPPVPGGIGAPPGQMITNRSVSAGSGPLPPQTSVAGPPSSYPNMPATSSPGLMGLPPHMMGEQGGGIQRSNSAPVMPASSSPGLVNGYPTSQSRTPPASHSRSTPPMGPGQMNGPPAGKVGAPPYPGQPAGAPPRPGMMPTTSVGPAPMFNQPGMPGPPRPMMSQPGPPRPPMMSQPGPPRPPMMSQPGPPRPPVPTISQPVLPASLSAPLSMTTNGPSNSSQGSVNGLPVPFHGQGQYSHQLGATPDKNTQGITPTNSAPSSQKSSRGPSPIPGTKYDALEGQFTPSPQAGPKSPPAFPVQNMPPPPMGQHAPPMGQHAPPMGQHAPPMGQHAPPMGQNLPPMMGQNFPPVSQHVPPMGQNVPPMGQNVPPMGQNVPPMGQNMPPMGQNAPPMGQNMPPMGQNAPPMGQNMPPMGAVNQGPVSQQPGGIAGRRQYPTQSYGNAPAAPPSSMSQPAPGTMPGMNASPAMAGALPGGLPQGAPQQPNHAGQANNAHPLSSSFNNMKLQPMEGRTLNLLQERALISQDGIETARPNLNHDFKKVNCSPDVFRCTLNTIPQTQSLLNKCRLPLGILIHPFKDLSQLPVIQSNVIVRCRSCRTYINPFVTFIDMRRWKCNLCYRVNELPEEFNYDPVSRTYGEPQRRPEIRSSTIEFIASSDYMLRPPQPAVYLYVLDVSFNAVSTGYLQVFCQTLLEELERIPGDSRTQIGFITFDRALHFYNLAEGLSQPQMLVVTDIDDAFLPLPDNLLVNLNESKDLVIDLLNRLPSMFEKNMETGSCLGATLQAAYKLMSNTGGRVSVFQTQLPTVGPGALKNREDPNERSGKNVHNLGPATDFYKKMSLDCSARQIAVDLFLLNSQYSDIASIAGVAKYSGGSLFNFPNLHTNNNPAEVDRFEGVVRRYVTRKVGLEAVMRIRCTRGLSIHTFHGNFFVRSTDLLSLPNINPDSGFGMQMSVEDTIESNTASFQAALLYTSSKGERRIRVHTMCLPVTNNLTEIMTGADQQAILSMLSKMAYDKCISQSMSDARDAMINAAVDMLTAFGGSLTQSQRMGQLPICYSLRLMPLFILSLLKYVGFRVGSTTKLDDRVFALEQCKTMPLMYLMLEIYPTLQPVHALDDKNAVSKGDEVIAKPPILQLSFAHMDRHGAYLMDTGSRMYLWVGAAISDHWCQEVFDVPNFKSLQDGMTELPEQDNPTSDRLRTFISHLNDQRPFPASLLVLREDSRMRQMFLQHMVEDRTENTMSYYEFLQHLQKEIKS